MFSVSRIRFLPAAAAALLSLALGCGGDIDARMAEVRALQDVGQFQASIDELRQILATAPDLPEATYRLGVALVQTGEPSRAVWALEKAAETQEYAIPAALLLASAHFSQQNYEAAIRSADRVLELDPNRHAALQLRAQGNLGAGRLDAALEDTERLLEVYPDDYGVYAIYATLLGDMDRTDEAKEAHDRLKELALSGSDPSIAHRGCLAPALFARDELKDRAKAAELFDDCTERFPTNGFVVGEAMKFYDQAGAHAKSTELIRRAVEEAPENLSLRSHLSNRLLNRGDRDGAEQVLLDAVESFKSAGAWNLLAGFYRREENWEKALEALDQVAELSGGGSDQLRFTQADALIDLEQYDRAAEIADSLQEPTYAKLLRGRIALERGEPQRALELFEQGIRAWPNNSGARFLAGRAARELGDFDRAISELREAIRVDDGQADAAHLLARIHFERGQYSEALRVAKLATRRRNADLLGLYTIAARTYTALGEYGEARSVIEVMREQTGDVQRAAIELAAVERAAEGPRAAMVAIETSGVNLADPANGEALRSWVDAALAANRAEEALVRLDGAIARSPETPAFHEMRGGVLIRLGRNDEAKRALERAIELDEGYAEAYAGLATLAGNRKDLKGAIAYYDEAHKRALDKAAYPYAAAQLTWSTGDRDAAEKRLRYVVRRFPEHAGARNDLAWILAEKGEELDWALSLAEEAQRLDPSPDILDTLGWVRLRRGEHEAAVAALEQAAEERSDSPSILYRLGVALARNGDEDRAREMLQTAVDAGAFPEAADAKRELAQLTP